MSATQHQINVALYRVAEASELLAESLRTLSTLPIPEDRRNGIHLNFTRLRDDLNSQLARPDLAGTNPKESTPTH